MFTKAIVRKPGRNFAQGITSANLGKPDYPTALSQHEHYCEALRTYGLELTLLEPDLDYPDGCFVEDVAVITEKCAIITRPGDKSRQGEEKKIEDILAQYMKIERIVSPGTVDGGDILRMEDHFYIGLSQRTNQQGAHQLKSILENHGYAASTIPVKGILHLQTGATYIGRNHVVAIPEFADAFKGFRVIEADKEEAYAANCLSVNDFLLMPAGFAKTKQKILKSGYQIMEIEMSEFRKMDGGLTCLSLMF